jgi:WXG100 family type VII secretion target
MENITLKVRPQVLVAKSGELNAEKGAIGGMMDEVKAKMASLSGTWRSISSDEYQTRFRQVHADIDGMLATVAEYVKDLNDAANVYDKTEQTAKTVVQASSTGGVFNN